MTKAIEWYGLWDLGGECWVTANDSAGEPGAPILAFGSHSHATECAEWFAHSSYLECEPRRLDGLPPLARHHHVAGDGKDIDTCKACGHDIRNEVHLRVGESA